MNDFLLDLGYSEDLIEKIIDANGGNTYMDLCLNEEKAISVINYFKTIGISCIEELLVYKIDIFFKDVNDLKRAFSKKNVEDAVKMINEDFFKVDFLLNE